MLNLIKNIEYLAKNNSCCFINQISEQKLRHLLSEVVEAKLKC